MAPIVVVVVVSFGEAEFISFPIQSVSLRWYRRIVEYRPFIDSLLVSLQLAFSSALLACLLGIPAALALARSQRPLAQALATFLLAPLSMPAIVLGFALLYYLSALGFGVSFDALLVAHTVIAIPYVTRNVIAVYRAVPGDLEEAAAILGAGRFETFRLVTLPLIKPGVFAGSLFAILISLDNLPISFFFGTSSTNTLPVVMLSYLQNQFDPSVAAVCTVQMALAVVALLVVERIGDIRSASV
ncbi:MAG: ABC transporter permease [Alphaproteobacteria bacterium]|nr:ABC transporter permease [Alphaproteobacteria bacterium]